MTQYYEHTLRDREGPCQNSEGGGGKERGRGTVFP